MMFVFFRLYQNPDLSKIKKAYYVSQRLSFFGSFPAIP